jgi:microcystin degradation protein MlrC
VAGEAAAAGCIPVFITDSGDNVTAGAAGDSPLMLAEALALAYGPAGILVAGIVDRPAVQACMALAAGSPVSLAVGGSLDPSSPVCRLDGVLRWRGRILDNSGQYGTGAILVRAGSPALDVIITDDRCAFTTPAIIESAGTPVADYRIILVKQGYLYPELRRLARRTIMALSPGSACLDTSRFTYSHVRRPIFPLDPAMTWDPANNQDEEMI